VRRRRYMTMIVMTLFLVFAMFFATLLSDSRPLLGLDLKGGISVVLFPVRGSDTSTLDTATDIIRNRIDALGLVEPQVSRQGNTIVVDLPGAKNRQQALSIIGQTAQLRFRPVCTPAADFSRQARPATLASFAPIAAGAQVAGCEAPPATEEAAATTTTTAPGQTTTTTTATGETTTSVAPPASAPAHAAITSAAGISPRGGQTTTPTEAPTTEAPTTTGAGATTTTAPATTTTTLPSLEQLTAGIPSTSRRADLPERLVILPCHKDSCGAGESRLVLGRSVLSGDAIGNAKAQLNQQGSWIVQVHFRNNDFVKKVAEPYVEKRVAIVLDGVVQSAPKINAGITGRDVEITGSFTQSEAKDLALVLKYGSLPVQFDPDQQTVRSVSPSLGSDQLRAGIIAGIVGLILVAIYTLLYYRILGAVVIAGLVLTGMILFAVVTYLGKQFNQTLTLAGITGIIVSVGVTVDSYIVYFERLKDEIRLGKNVQSAVDTGWRRAWRTIIAADLVSFIAAAILYMLAEGSVRGFAFFLGLSTLIDLAISYFFMHPLVALMSRRPGLVRTRGVGIASGLDVAGVEA
jgi:preprotein translocase subunit SecD